MSVFIPLCVPNFEGNEIKYVNDVLEQGWVSTGGSYITELEKNLADFVGVDNVAACQSGTSALHLALVDIGVQPCDMVLVPTITFIAAVNPVRYQFATPVFIDCDDSLCMDPVKLKSFCDEECTFVDNKLIHNETKQHVKALVVVHVFGNMADMVAIMDVAQKYNIKVIEDATEALGTRYISGIYEGKFAGTIGDYGAYSFNGNKIITTGGGGAVTSHNSDVVDHLRYLSTQAKDDSHYYIHNEIGFNYRMTNVQAALGVAQLEELAIFIERKNKNYELYKQLFKNYEYGEIMSFRNDIYSNKWFYSLKIDRTKIDGTMRNIITRLEAKNVGTRSIWGLIHEQLPYRDCIAYKMEKAPYYASCILNLPASTSITEDEIRYVVKSVKEVLEELRNK